MNRAPIQVRFAVLRSRVIPILFAIAFAFNFLLSAPAQEFVPDELIVVFDTKIGEKQKEQIHRGHGQRAIKNLKGINGQLVKVNDKKLTDALQDYRDDPGVRFVELNYVVRAVAAPNDLYWSSLWGLQNVGQSIWGVKGTSGADIRAAQAWSITTGSADIVVGLVDSGVNYSHPDLALNIWSNPGGINGGPVGSHGYNAITKSFNPADDNGHGTLIAGIIGALGNNSIGSVGVNWRVSMLPLKFLGPEGTGTVADAIDAIDFAVDAKKSGVNIRVLNNSWGSSGFSSALLEQIRIASENDILFVAAAGNDSANNDTVGFYPANYNLPNVVAVAATDNNDLLASFSNYGANSVELGAPGVDILSTYYTPSTAASGYAWSSGTSMATPHVAGAAALVLANGYQSFSTLRNTILTSVDPLASLAMKTISGGRLNVYKALTTFAVSVTPVSPVLNPGESVTLSTVTTSGGTPPFAYSWSNSTASLGLNTPSISVNAIDTYSCTVTDSSIPPRIATGSTTLLKPTPIITWATPADITYGTPLSSAQFNATANVPGSFVYSRDVGTVLPAGNYTLSVVFYPQDSATFNSASMSVPLKIRKAPLEIRAVDASKLYGAVVPQLSVTYTGFVNGESSAFLATPAVVATTAKTNSPAGVYPITVNGATAINYDITFVSGVLTVERAPLIITAVDKTKAYKASLPTLSLIYSGFVNGDSSSKLTTQPVLATTATAASSVGSYPITVSGATSTNYTITFVNGTLTVTPLALKITAVNKTKTYGAALPALTASYSGFASGETVTNLDTQPVLTTTATASSPIGVYPITASGAAGQNYTITYIDGTLTVNPATLTISAQSKTKYYGAVMPALTASYSGFVNGDTVATLVTPAAMDCPATLSSPVGVYPITISGATAANYTIKFVNSTLTVKAASLSIRAVSKSAYYGAAVLPLTYTVTGFVLGETEAVLTSPVTLSCDVLNTSPAASYPILISGGTNSNYAVQYVNSVYSVKPASLTISASSKSKYYGADVPPLTYTASGFVLGETEAILTSPVSINCAATASSVVGSYPITITGGTNANYAVRYVNSTLAIRAAPLSVRAASKTKVYGAALPALTYTITGFVLGETESVLATPVTIASTASAESNVGTYPITVSGATAANYAISFSAASLTVSKAPLTVKADNLTKQYLAPLPLLTYVISGFVNGDTEANLDVPVAITTTATQSSAVGNYSITPKSALDANYTISFVNGILTVTP